MDKIWVGSPTDVREGKAANEALAQTNDSQFWEDDTGIVEVSDVRWRQAQQFELEGWLNHWGFPPNLGIKHKQGFNGYVDVPKKLGNVIEIGCGPFTQLRTIQDGREIETVTLLDPLLDRFLQLPNCSYKNGQFMGKYPTTMYTKPAEQLNNVEEFDTAICINVLEHVQSVPTILTALARSLKPGGVLIFGEKAYDGLDITQSYDVGHPIRVKMKVFLEWESQFTPLYCVNPELGDPFQQEHYFIGIK